MDIRSQLLDAFNKVLEEPNHDKLILVSLTKDGGPKSTKIILDELLEKGYMGIYGSFVKPYEQIKDEFPGQTRLLVIDAVSKVYGQGRPQEENVKYIGGPMSLSEFTEKARSWIEIKSSPKMFLFIDSLTVLEIFNPIEKLEKLVEEVNEIVTSKRIIAIGTMYDVNNFQIRLKDKIHSLDLTSLHY